MEVTAYLCTDCCRCSTFTVPSFASLDFSMKKLGALTKGDRRAAGTGQKGGVEDFDIDDGIGQSFFHLFSSWEISRLACRKNSLTLAHT